MSEFIAVCPKCRQQILCDTAYIGKRIACPVCLQEISMPEPTQASSPVAPNLGAAVPMAAAPIQANKNNPMILVAAIGTVAVILAVVAAVLVLHKEAPSAPNSPTSPSLAAAQSPPPAVTSPSTPTAATQSSPQNSAITASGTLDQCRAIWTFNQDSGDTVIDSTGNGNNATVMGGQPNWLKATNPDSAGLRLDGSDCVEANGAVINTAQSFTVAARVSMDKMEAKKYQTFVSIDGNEISAFYLQFNPFAGGGTGRFEFDRMEGDSKTGTKVAAKAKPAISTNTWYHLTGVYNAEAQSISLYLDGKFQDTVPYINGWQANGKTAVGRGRSAGRNANYFTGAIRDVRFYGFALTADQVKKISK